MVRHPGRAPKNNPRFVITNPADPPKAVYKVYCGRGDMLRARPRPPGPAGPDRAFPNEQRAALTGFFHPRARVPEAVQAYLAAALAVDARSPNGVLKDWRTVRMKTDPARLTMPPLVIYGADDDREALGMPGIRRRVPGFRGT